MPTKKTTKAPTPKAHKPKPAPKPKIVMYASKKIRLVHPYQNICFNPGEPTACEKDSWLSSQINAGLIAQC